MDHELSETGAAHAHDSSQLHKTEDVAVSFTRTGYALPLAEKPFKSIGRKITIGFTYGFVDWLLNGLIGVGYAYLGTRTELGKSYWSGPISGFFRKHLSPHILGDLAALTKEQQQSEEFKDRFDKANKKLNTSVRNGNIFVSIITGGMFTIPPLLFLERNSVQLKMTKFFDRIFHGKEKVENDPEFQKQYEEIETAPKKKFWTGMYTRFMALSPLLAILLFPPTEKIVQKIYFGPLAWLTKGAAEGVGIKPSEHMTTVQPGHEDTHWKFLHDAIAMDFGLGPIYAVMHGWLYHRFAGKHQQPDANIAAKETAPPIVAGNHATKPISNAAGELSEPMKRSFRNIAAAFKDRHTSRIERRPDTASPELSR